MNLTVVSSLAEDRIYYKDQQKAVVRQGGPALWISKALKDIGVSFNLVVGERSAVVEINVSREGEQGKIISVPSSPILQNNEADIFLISTIADEFPLSRVAGLHGSIALDVQGYVRSAKLKKHSKLRIPLPIRRNILFLKATEEEILFLEDSFIKNQQQKTFLITKGKQGVEMYCLGRRYNIHTKIVHRKNAIGAGDTFFAAFVASFLKTKDVLTACRFAVSYTRIFLNKKPGSFV